MRLNRLRHGVWLAAWLVIACAALGSSAGRAEAAKTKIVLLAGTPSHGPGEHEFNAGITLLAGWLKNVKGVEPVVVRGGWPDDEKVFDGAATLVFYMDGGGGHPMLQGNRMETMCRLMAKGVGLVCLHYAVEFPKEHSESIFQWLGGYYETGYSTNPVNETDLTPSTWHPVARGVTPFRSRDEWYYHIRFRAGDGRVTSVLSTLLPKEKPALETVAWVVDRSDGGRSFGFTGGHFHDNWNQPNFRTLVLNAILWTAKQEVPKGGVKSVVTPEQMAANLDPKK